MTLIEKLRNNKIAIVPHDTIPGIIARMSVSNAEKILTIKQRNPNKGFILLIPDPSHLSNLCMPPSMITQYIMTCFWPGPLTIIFKKHTHMPPIISGNQPTIAIRQPNHDVLSQVLTELNEPLISTSANISNDAKITQKILDSVDYIHPLIHPNSPINHTLASTILDGTTTPPKICRYGSIESTDIYDCINRYKSNPNAPDK